MPSLIELIGEKNISWTKANKILFNHVRKSFDEAVLAGCEIIKDANFFTILKNKYEGNDLSDAMFDFYNFIFEKLNELLSKEEKKLLQKTILNIMTDMTKDYLNFIGELAVLYIFKASGQYTLLSVEEKLHPDKDISADFLFRNNQDDKEDDMPNTFATWEDETCRGCGAKAKKRDREYSTPEPFSRFECPECGYEGCSECMPNGRGSKCEECVDPETGE